MIGREVVWRPPKFEHIKTIYKAKWASFLHVLLFWKLSLKHLVSTRFIFTSRWDKQTGIILKLQSTGIKFKWDKIKDKVQAIFCLSWPEQSWASLFSYKTLRGELIKILRKHNIEGNCIKKGLIKPSKFKISPHFHDSKQNQMSCVGVNYDSCPLYFLGAKAPLQIARVRK